MANQRMHLMTIPLALHSRSRIRHLPQSDLPKPGSTIGSLVLILLIILLWMLVYRKQNDVWRRVFLVASGFLFVLVHFKYGYFNDLVMRASIPALFCLALLTYRVRLDSRHGRRFCLFLTAILLMGALTPAIEMSRHGIMIIRNDFRFKTHDVTTLQDIDRASTMEGPFFYPYVGDPEGVFFQLFARQALE